MCAWGGGGGGVQVQSLNNVVFWSSTFSILTDGRGALYKYSKENLYPVAKWLDTECWLCNFKFSSGEGGYQYF